MKFINSIKILVISIIVFSTNNIFACWYNQIRYNDYIFGINNFEQHTLCTTENSKLYYTVKNNQIVDLPISVSIYLDNNISTTFDPNSELTCKLQYRILPNGTWQTVAERTFILDTIKKNTIAKFYLGRNNICPQKIEQGTVLMIRAYISRGFTQSGELTDLCDKTLQNNKLQDSYSYTVDNSNVTQYDLGGKWLPHLVTTVIFSGKYRPVR